MKKSVRCLSSPRRNSSTQHNLLTKIPRNEAKINQETDFLSTVEHLLTPSSCCLILTSSLDVAQVKIFLLKLSVRFVDERSYLISKPVCSIAKVGCLHLSSSKVRCAGSFHVLWAPSSRFAAKYRRIQLTRISQLGFNFVMPSRVASDIFHIKVKIMFSFFTRFVFISYLTTFAITSLVFLVSFELRNVMKSVYKNLDQGI